ncbi:MAG: MEDS domain-containing protein [Candidatus Eremiobacteraeota bacterium]|nr:MEDS domain-containing protein [Candidatus Eremiobacteraeota bacterium]MBC5826365.1 MEDS domain-containing protein [Candidatus Eremiobacteraeota bacterium]
MTATVTIKELAARLGISVPTLRKYGECGLLVADSAVGRTHLYDEAVAVARVKEINRLKGSGYSLSLIRQKLDQNAPYRLPVDPGLDGPDFTLGRHALLVLNEKDEYDDFARRFIASGLHAAQAVIVVAHPNLRAPLEEMIAREGFNVEALVRQHQLAFVWHEIATDFDARRQVDALDHQVRAMMEAGWQKIRMLGHPRFDKIDVDSAPYSVYEQRLTAWAKLQPVIVVCPWIASSAPAESLLNMQSNHREFMLGESNYIKA